jgi:hypothetical protein
MQPTEWNFYREGSGNEKVELEQWVWTAIYLDGSQLQQFDDEGRFHQFKEIDQTRLNAFVMSTPDGSHPAITLKFEPWFKLIHFYRNIWLQDGAIKIRLYCFGYETPYAKVIMVIMPDGSMIITENVDSVKIEAVAAE